MTAPTMTGTPVDDRWEAEARITGGGSQRPSQAPCSAHSDCWWLYKPQVEKRLPCMIEIEWPEEQNASLEARAGKTKNGGSSDE